jgi:hypothetical protein
VARWQCPLFYRLAHAHEHGGRLLLAPEAFFDFSGVFLGLHHQLIGCNQLQFAPSSFTSNVDTADADHATGLSIDVHVPQEVNENAAGLASSNVKTIKVGFASANVKSISVIFPPGISTNPSSADGLEACSEAQVGFDGDRSGERD